MGLESLVSVSRSVSVGLYQCVNLCQCISRSVNGINRRGSVVLLEGNDNQCTGEKALRQGVHDDGDERSG